MESVADKVARIRAEKSRSGWREHDFHQREAEGAVCSSPHSWYPYSSPPIGTGIGESTYMVCNPSFLREGEKRYFLGRHWTVDVSEVEAFPCSYQDQGYRAVLLLSAEKPAEVDPDFRPPAVETGSVIPIRLGPIEVEGLNCLAAMVRAERTGSALQARVGLDGSAPLVTHVINAGLRDSDAGQRMMPSLSPVGVELVDVGQLAVTREMASKIMTAATNVHIWRGLPASEAAKTEYLLRLAFMSALRLVGFYEELYRFNARGMGSSLRQVSDAFMSYLKKYDIPVSIEA